MREFMKRAMTYTLNSAHGHIKGVGKCVEIGRTRCCGCGTFVVHAVAVTTVFFSVRRGEISNNKSVY